LRVKIEMSSKRASVNPLDGFLKPQSPAERLAAQQRDLEKHHCAAPATASAITNSISSAQAAFTGGLSNSKINSRQGPPEVQSNSKINSQTPHVLKN